MALNVKEFYIFYIINFLILPLGFFIRLIYTNSLSVSEVGAIYALISTISFLYFFASLGLSNSLKYYIPKFLTHKTKESKQKIANITWYTFGIQIALGGVLSFILYKFSQIIAESYLNSSLFTELTTIFCFYFFFLILFVTIRDLFNAHELHSYSKLIGFSQMSSILIISLILYGYHSFISNINLLPLFALGWVIGTALPLIIFSIILFYKFPHLLLFPRFEKKLFLDHIQYSYYTLFSGLGVIILNQIDIIVITYFMSTVEVAHYSNAYALNNFFAGSFAVLSIIFMPLFSKLQEEKDFGQLNRILNILYGLVLFLLLPISLLFFLFPEQIIKLVFGPEYVLGASVLGMLSLFSIFKIYSQYNMSFMNGLGKAKQLARILMPVVVINLLLNVLLIEFFGIEGVAVATIVGWIILTVACYFIVSKQVHFNLDMIKILKIIILGIVFVGIVYILKSILQSLLGFYIVEGIIILIGLGCYVGLGYVLGVFSIKELYNLFPESDTRNSFIKLHKKYFSFLK